MSFSDIDLSSALFETIAKTHQSVFAELSSDVEIVFINGKYVQKYKELEEVIFPTKKQINIDSGVMMTPELFLFIKKIEELLPNNTSISNAYIPPYIQAEIGLTLYSKYFPNNDLNILTDKKTNPELVGQYKEYFLSEFNYSSIKEALHSVGINWANINKSNHQKGIEIDLIGEVNLIKDLIEVLNLKDVVSYSINNNILHIELSDDYIFKPFAYNSIGITNISNRNNVSDIVNASFQSKAYNILDKHGYGDLTVKSGLSQQQLSSIPNNVKNKGTELSKAITEILKELLDGEQGIISNYIASQNEYILTLLRGSTAALDRMAILINHLTDGRASRAVLDGFMGEAFNTPSKDSLTQLLIDQDTLSKASMSRVIFEKNKDSLLKRLEEQAESEINLEALLNGKKTEAEDYLDVYKTGAYANHSSKYINKSVYVEELTIPSRRWVVQHNLNDLNVEFTCYDELGNRVHPGKNRDESTNNTLVLDFNYMAIGKVVVFH